MKKRKILFTFVITILILLSINKSVFADEVKEIEYGDSSDIVVETDNLLMPFMTKSKKSENYLISQITSFIQKIGATFESSYRTTGMKVKHQDTTGECWAFAYSSAYEAYNLKKNGSTDIYSPRHIDYSCSKSVTGAPINANLFNRETTENVGNYYLATAYAASGKGVVLESDMPFKKDVTIKESYDTLVNKKAQKQLDETIIMDSIYKVNNGRSVKYYADSSYTTELSNATVTNIRSSIKEQIKNNGSIATTIYEETDSPNVCATDSTKPVNHAVLVVGWDDNYQAEGWATKGAYIALNSYGENLFDNGYVYISYDDIWVENGMVGIKKTSDIDFSKVYEHDPYGAVTVVYSAALSNGTQSAQNLEEMSAINVFSRDSSKKEMLKEIGVSLFSYEKAEVYFTEEFDSETGLPLKFKKVANMTDTLNPGFVTIQFDEPVILTKDKFAICVRFVQDNEEKIATVAIEGRVSGNHWWDNVTGNKGESYFVDVFNPSGSNMYWTLSAGSGNETYYRNASIKAYTSEYTGEKPDDPTPEQPDDFTITSSEYRVNTTNKMIARLSASTDINTFKSKIAVSKEYKIVDKNGNEITSGIMKTGYKVKVGNVEYVVSVIGDISGDGLVNTLDLARIRFHLVSKKGYILEGAFLEAADLNGNGSVTITDLARMRMSM